MAGDRAGLSVCKKSGRVKVRVKKIEGQIWKQRKQREGAKMVKKRDGFNKEIHIDCSIYPSICQPRYVYACMHLSIFHSMHAFIDFSQHACIYRFFTALKLIWVVLTLSFTSPVPGKYSPNLWKEAVITLLLMRKIREEFSKIVKRI